MLQKPPFRDLYRELYRNVRISAFSLWHFVIVILILIVIDMSGLFDHEKLEGYHASLSQVYLEVRHWDRLC